MLTRLIYASRSKTLLGQEDIEQILDAARTHNLVDGVTGMLCYGNGRFLQCLEGDEDRVDAIYARIQNDPRHSDLAIIDRKPLNRRLFGDWSMGFIDIDDLWTGLMIRDTGRMDQFLPETMDADTALRLINSLKSALGDQVIV